ncbi:MAG: 50S ribosomal protein L17 [Candidatus Harrisonbacteria bacterium RIFCSPLOWO2_02_FULL_45_10c]|uniref:50S ribosomal protein L17 n=1 Tax=Candidatus Harrisonbacteria bacterium RIFCSPLOWO2_02_FULL_45_10c TaxID=1798410 RepID=A0A1G1ZTU2_9BACT|nr:MAG: 50S ribosomal protein L17 [Candidatus Harrisonbacteria bacterium RIFCSPLOWO2_02_FULL_45_10c]
MNRKFHRKRGQRKSFLQGLANNLIMKERIQTTDTRAREIRPIVERMVTTAKKQNLASFRILLSKLPKTAASKLYYEIAKRYENRPGGYLRILKLGARRMRDASRQAIIEFV